MQWAKKVPKAAISTTLEDVFSCIRAQYFTSLKADIRQNINGGALMEHFLKGSAPLRLW